MLKISFKIYLLFTFFLLISTLVVKSEIVDTIKIEGNERISSETIKMFSDVSYGDDLSESDLNKILKNYIIQIFDIVSVKIINKTLIIKVEENPIIQKINYKGIKSSKILEDLKKCLTEI